MELPTSKNWAKMLWLFLIVMELVQAGLDEINQEQDDSIKCAPSTVYKEYNLCYDMDLNAYFYNWRNVLQTGNEQPGPKPVFDGFENKGTNSPLDAFQETKKREFSDISKSHRLKNLVQRILNDRRYRSRVSIWNGAGLAKRPFDSIAYGSYFGGFGRK